MDWALSESIFCWPRRRFFREERFRVEAARVGPVLADVEDNFALLLWAAGLVVAGLFAVAPPLELCRAVAAPQAHITIRAHNPISRDFETSIETPKTISPQNSRKIKSPTGRWHCNHPR